MPERDHPALIAALLLLLIAPATAVIQAGYATGLEPLLHALGLVLLVSGAFFVLGLADTGILGFVGAIALCSWVSSWLLPAWSLVLAIPLGAVATGLLVVLTQGLPKVVTLAASLVTAVLLVQAIPDLAVAVPLSQLETGTLSAAAVVALLLLLALSRSVAADALRLRLQADERAKAMLLAVPAQEMQLLVAAAGGAIAAVGAVLLDRVDWTPATGMEADGNARLVTALAVAAVVMIGGQQRLSHLLIVSLPLLVLPASVRLLAPGLPDPTPGVALLGLGLAVWLGKSSWAVR